MLYDCQYVPNDFYLISAFKKKKAPNSTYGLLIYGAIYRVHVQFNYHTLSVILKKTGREAANADFQPYVFVLNYMEIN